MTKLVEQQIKRHMHDIMNLCQLQRKHRVEHGFTICHKTKKTSSMGRPLYEPTSHTIIKGRCKGNKCEVAFKGCDQDFAFASCHSHPMGATTMPSTQDVALSIHQGERAFCICAPSKGRDLMQCYEITQDQNTKDTFLKHFLQHNDNQMMDIIVKSIFRGDDTTLFRPIIDVVKKRKK